MSGESQHNETAPPNYALGWLTAAIFVGVLVLQWWRSAP